MDLLGYIDKNFSSGENKDKNKYQLTGISETPTEKGKELELSSENDTCGVVRKF